MPQDSTPSGRTIAIGDIHGCQHALQALLGAIAPTAADTIVTLGDVIDRGPNSREVIQTLIDLSSRCQLVPLLGNHEEMLLTARIDPDSLAVLSTWLRNGGTATLESYGQGVGPQDIPDDHIEFVESCVEYYETETHIFVHGNYDPNRPIDQQGTFTLLWESLRARVPERHVSGKTIVVGHTAQREGQILDRGYLKCIDTHCYGGGWLTALDAASGHVWQANQDGELREMPQSQPAV
jgi:serine/threonine protein phosphatase 1